MGLFDFLKKPKWKNSNSQVRLTAVEDMSADDLETLLEIIRKDSDRQVRLAALTKVNDRNSMELLLQEELSEELIAPARVKLEEIYRDLIISETGDCDCGELLALIRNQDVLAAIVARADSVFLRCQAVAAIDDQRLLCELLKQHIGKKPALAAVEKIDDPHLLAEIAEKAINKSARSAAVQKLNPETSEDKETVEPDSTGEPVQTQDEQAALGRQEKKVNNDKIITEKIHQRRELCAQLESLCKVMEENSQERFVKIENRWPAADPEIDTEELLALQKQYEELSHIFHTTVDELRNEKQNMEKLTLSCVQIEKDIQEDNLERAGSLLQKSIQALEHLTWRWLKKDDIAARFSACQKQLEQRKEEIGRAEKELLQALTDCCVEMEELAASAYTVQADKKARKSNASWTELTKSAGQHSGEFAARFQAAEDTFLEKKKQFYKEQEWQHWNNKTQKEELCTTVELLKEENDLHQVSGKLKECQAAWKKIGPVHKKYSQDLWSRFKSSCDENYARCRVFYAELDQKRQESLVIKEELCIRAEEHVASTQWKESAEVLQGLQREWKEAGPGERSREQVIFKRFKQACDQFFERRNAFFAKQDAERKDNLLAKEELCQKVEDLLREPKLEHGKVIQELQKSWKEIGPVPRKNDQKIWKRFRGACDSYYDWLDEQRQENLQQKILLCEQVEALLPEKEGDVVPKETVDKVVKLQQEWKTIGPVPRKDDDTVWERFTSQCDTFFVARKIRAQEEEAKRLENKSLKEKLLRKAGEVIQQQDEKEVGVALQELQKEWKKVGPVPREYDQLLWDEFQGLCNAFFQQKADRYKEKKAVLDENLKKKEELCLQLERLTGHEQDSASAEKEGALDLIEQFKIARETNFLLAGKTESSQQKKEEVLRIQREWKTLGPTFREHERRLWRRYRKAIDLFFAK